MKTTKTLRNVFLFALIPLSSVAFSQVFSVGPAVGMNLSKHTNLQTGTYKPGFAGGVSARFSPWSCIAINMQALYSQKGINYTRTFIAENGTMATADHAIRLNYLEVPILFEIFLSDYRMNFRPKVVFGPAVNVFLSGKDKEGNMVGHDWKNPDLSLMLGGGFQYKLTERMGLTFDVRYSYSMFPLQPEGAQRNIYNHGLTSLVGLNFTIGEATVMKNEDTGRRLH